MAATLYCFKNMFFSTKRCTSALRTSHIAEAFCWWCSWTYDRYLERGGRTVSRQNSVNTDEIDAWCSLPPNSNRSVSWIKASKRYALSTPPIAATTENGSCESYTSDDLYNAQPEKRQPGLAGFVSPILSLGLRDAHHLKLLNWPFRLWHLI